VSRRSWEVTPLTRDLDRAPNPLAMENDMTRSNAKPKIAEVARLQEKQNASAASTPDLDGSCYRTLLEQASILEDEDQELYNQIHNAVFDEVRPQTFLEKLAVKDFADKVFEELRLKTAIVGLIDGARQSCSFQPNKEREFSAIQSYLPHLQKLQRMKEQSEASRRALMKEFRKAGASKEGSDPETSAKPSTKTSKPK
jgi:hypothetical protein